MPRVACWAVVVSDPHRGFGGILSKLIVHKEKGNPGLNSCAPPLRKSMKRHTGTSNHLCIGTSTRSDPYNTTTSCFGILTRRQSSELNRSRAGSSRAILDE